MYERCAAFVCLFILLLAPSCLTAAEDAITLDSIVQMQGSGLSDTVIIQAVKAAPAVKVDVSTNGLIALKQAGFSDALILAIVERQSARGVASPVTSSTSRFIVRQNGRELELVSRQLETSFVASKAKSSDEVIKYGTLGAGVTAASGIISQLALAGAAGRAALGVIAGGIVYGVNALGKKPTYQEGFWFELIRGKSSTLELQSQPGFDVILPLVLFRDGSYQTAESGVFKLDVAGHDEFRVVASQKVKVHGGEKPDKKMISTKELHPVKVATEKTPERIVLHAEGLPAGEYAVAFQTGDQILPQLFDFKIRGPQ